MQPEQYTADVICHSMGIGPFVDPTWESSARYFRLLLKPSFDPEVCITIVDDSETARLTVRALSERLWHQLRPCRSPAHHETTSIGVDSVAKLTAALASAVADTVGRQSVCLDGMGMNCAWRDAEGADRLDSYVTGDCLQSFVSQTIDCAWHAMTHAGVRNALARCARYVGREYPTDPEPPKPELIRLGVFGEPEDVSDYFQLLNRKTQA